MCQGELDRSASLRFTTSRAHQNHVPPYRGNRHTRAGTFIPQWDAFDVGGSERFLSCSAAATRSCASLPRRSSQVRPSRSPRCADGSHAFVVATIALKPLKTGVPVKRILANPAQLSRPFADIRGRIAAPHTVALAAVDRRLLEERIAALEARLQSADAIVDSLEMCLLELRAEREAWIAEHA